MRPSRAVALPLLLVVLGGCGDAPGTSPAGVLPTGPASPRADSVWPPSTVRDSCPESGVLMWADEPSAATGLRSMSIALYNCGDRPRTLKGYPVIKFLDADDEPIDVAVGHGSASVARVESFDRPPERFDLAPGELASAGVLWRNLATADPKRAVTVGALQVTPDPAMRAERVSGVSVDLGTTRTVGVGPWVKMREANGAEIGDNAPHYGDNHAYLQRVRLRPAGRAAGEVAARRIRPALEPLRARGGGTAATVRAALLRLGFAADTTGTRKAPAGPGVEFEVFPGHGACVYGVIEPSRITMHVAGVRIEGGCAEP